MPLLERGTSGFRATLAGEAVLASATRIEQELVHCLETVASLSDPEAGRVSLRIISTAKYFAPRILTAYHRQHPRASVRLLVGNRAEMIRAMENGEADSAITGRPAEHMPVVAQVIGEYPHVVIAHPEHRLAHRPRIAIISRHAVMSELLHGEVVELDVEGFPIVRNWFLVRRKDKKLLPSQTALWDHICQTTQQITAPG